MHKKFDHQAIEQKWQTQWAADSIYDVGARDETRDKEYVLVELPYPSGNLHIGHWYAFAVPDIYVRAHRMQGKQIVYPMGFDAFGLPAENAAIKHNVNPREWTESNIEHMKTQLASMGASFSWNKTASTIDPSYYRWTQWMFTKFFEKGIAYRGSGTVNWCPGCNTVIANEQIIDGDKCERSGDTIEKRKMPQWMLKITDYADRLIDDLEALDWPEPIKDAQRNWIGRSDGAEIDFTLSTGDTVTVFTTRPDTLYGATYLVLAPEHKLIDTQQSKIANWDEVLRYIEVTKQKAEQDRLDGTKEKTGVKLEGITATNPASGEEIPVYIADYVLASYGTGAIMAVPAHDERDFAFAKKFDLPITQVVVQAFEGEGDDAPRHELPTLERDCIDLIIEHPSDGTFLVQKELDGERSLIHFVGGGTDGESDVAAIQRELLEETGFSEYEIVQEKPIYTTISFGYRHNKEKNAKGQSNFYHVKLTDLKQVPSEIEEGKHIVEWLTAEEVTKQLTWNWHAAAWQAFIAGRHHNQHGKLVNSGEFNGMDSEEAKAAITEKVGGRMTNTYRLRDWSVGRQRYWGVPVPIVYDPDGNAHPVPAEHLPWILPEDVDFRPTGEPPLAKSKELRERTEKIFGPGWTPEVETLDTFVDSSWYFWRYIDNQNDNEPASVARQQAWGPVDIYFGGAEHTTMHLLYSRFWQKALFDLGLAAHKEPYTRRYNRGLILGPDGAKMSKSKGNVIDPDEQVATVGSDAVKMYLAFMGPYGEVVNYPWDLGGIAGQRRFLERVNGLSDHIANSEPAEITKLLHKTIQKVTVDIEQFKFNTAISTMMVFVNTVEKQHLTQRSYELFLQILAPFAPHLTEELWHKSGKTSSIHLEAWPQADSDLAKDDTVTIGVQVNGKHRGEITIPPEAEEAAAMAAISENDELQAKVPKAVKKIIYVPGRILNIIGS